MAWHRHILRKVCCISAVTAYWLLCAWCSMVVYYHLPFFSQFCAWGYWLLAAALSIAVVFVKRKRLITSAAAAVLPLLVIAWWFTITPNNEADWQTPWAKMPAVEIRNNLLSIQNIRDFNYRSENDYDVKYISGDYDLDKLDKVMLILSYWDGNTAVAHTILDFGFNDGRWLTISSETRLKNGQRQTALGGLFKQYGSLFVIGTEADLLMLRTNYRKEQVYMYQLRITPAECRILLLDLVNRCNKLIAHPQFYNTITSNCMTSLVPSMRKVAHNKDVFKDIRFLKNGYSDQIIYEQNIKSKEISYGQFRLEHYITPRMQAVTDRDKYSEELHRTALTKW